MTWKLIYKHLNREANFSLLFLSTIEIITKYSFSNVLFRSMGIERVLTRKCWCCPWNRFRLSLSLSQWKSNSAVFARHPSKYLCRSIEGARTNTQWPFLQGVPEQTQNNLFYDGCKNKHKEVILQGVPERTHNNLLYRGCYNKTWNSQSIARIYSPK